MRVSAPPRVRHLPPRLRHVALLLAGLFLQKPVSAAPLLPRIVNGEVSAGQSAVAALLSDTAQGLPAQVCSATLISCDTVLTAAHCVCDDFADDAATCESVGVTPADDVQVFLQRAGFYPVATISIHPDYVFGVAADLAAIKLKTPVTGVRPAPINTIGPVRHGTLATIVGFGRTGGDPDDNRDVGIKRVGKVLTGPCPVGVPDSENVCWQFLGDDANTCDGDSGGPLFVSAGNGTADVLAGVTSAGESTTCLAPDRSNNTDVYANRAWIAAQAGGGLGNELCPLFPGGDPSPRHLLAELGSLSASIPEARFQVGVSPTTTLLRFAVNGEIVHPASSRANDFDLFVRAGAPADELEADCSDVTIGTFSFCEVSNPSAGEWHILVSRFRGAGQFQLVVTAYAGDGQGPCTGDCNEDAAVTVDELLTGVAIALGDRALNDCSSFDENGDGQVTVDEITRATVYALDGCP